MNTNTINITNNRFYDLFKVKIGSQVSYKVDFSVKLYVFDNYKFIEKILRLQDVNHQQQYQQQVQGSFMV